MRKIKEVLRLKFDVGLGLRQIARSCSIGLGTAHEYLQRAEAAKITWPLGPEWDDNRLEVALFGGPPRSRPTVLPMPDFADLHRQRQQHPHVTQQLLWEEYRQANPNGYQVRSTILTSQLPVSRWHEQIGDPTQADGILDRLVHNAHRIEMRGDSMRKNRGKPNVELSGCASLGWDRYTLLGESVASLSATLANSIRELRIMESAIPSHLRCPRTRPPRVGEDYTPPYPAWVARLDSSVKQVVMAYWGVQYRDSAGEATARNSISTWKALAARTDGPSHYDVAHYQDEAGFDTLVWIAYWSEPAQFRRWVAFDEMSKWWGSDDRARDGVGWFREVICPGVERFETLFSTPGGFEGVGVLAKAMSGEIQEHAYWGGMRDRLPLSQTDELRGSDLPRIERPIPGRVRVYGCDNLALIRSGQEWTKTNGQEREVYLEEVEPVLREGMTFLRDSGPEIGCFVNRYMTQLNESFKPLEKTFGMSLWRSLEHMERWAESHPTHVRIFASFMKMVQSMNFDLKLLLYHEVSVVPSRDQSFEYINCHPGTGLLRCAIGG